MNTPQVERNVPLPTSRVKRNYPYEDMNTGESFLVTDANLQAVCNANHRASKKLGRTFIARKVDGGIRVWRTE